jgi:hypothetical protein
LSFVSVILYYIMLTPQMLILLFKAFSLSNNNAVIVTKNDIRVSTILPHLIILPNMLTESIKICFKEFSD